jgi:hypothetical protein
MSTILVEPKILKGVALAEAGFSIGATVALAEPLVAANARLMLGRSVVAGIVAALRPSGIDTNCEFGVDPAETDWTGTAGTKSEVGEDDELGPATFVAVTVNV